LHNDNRQSFIDLWVFLANRYKDKQYVMFGIMNEPFSHCTITSRAQSQHMGYTYATYMAQVVDAIHNAGATNLIFIDKPYTWADSGDINPVDVQPVNRDGIVWEDHYYVDTDTTAQINLWKARLDAGIAKFTVQFGKPFYIGEYGPFPTNLAGWLDVLTQLTAYLQGKVAGRAWHEWGALAGEYYNEFSVADSETLLSTVYPI
jgi:aryl-phospho-beta-D-glucosidase BglC (GH1 family)